MHYGKRQKYLPRMTNMRISSTQTKKQQRNTYQQNLELNLESLWKHYRLEKNVQTCKLSPNAIGRTQRTQMPWNKKKSQNELATIYRKEQTEYIQNQIAKIRDSEEDRQSRIAWRMINKVSRRKSTAKAKLKTTNKQERIRESTGKPTESYT